MKAIRKKQPEGLTLIEVMLVVLIISVAVLGATSFRVFCVTDAKKADVQINAARISSMLLETWKGMGGLNNYDPSVEFPLSTYGSQFTITKTSSGPAVPTGFTPLASKYMVLDKANNVYYYVALSYKGAIPSPPEPLALNAMILWRQTYSSGSLTGNEHTIKMTTYVN